MMFINRILTVFIITCFSCNIYCSDIYGYDLPLFPPDLAPIINDTRWNQSTIPKHVWIAVRNSSNEKPIHTAGLMARNKNWNFHFCGNEEKDEFMRTSFPNTSILWAYEVLNPHIGCSKPEIWRLAVLYKYGGIYIDDDADIKTPFDRIIGDNDRFICGKEDYAFDDRCFVDDYPLSNRSFNIRFGDRNKLNLAGVGDKFFFNWALFSVPRHPIIIRVFEHIRRLIKAEYMGESLIKMHPTDHRGKLLMCATTFPITHSVREILLENNYSAGDLGLHVGNNMFREWGADMKAWNNDHAPDRWVKMIHKHRTPYLKEYAPPNITKYDGKLIMQNGQRDIYLVRAGVKHGFPDFQTFVAMKFDTGDVVQLPHSIMVLFPTGELLPKILTEKV